MASCARPNVKKMAKHTIGVGKLANHGTTVLLVIFHLLIFPLLFVMSRLMSLNLSNFEYLFWFFQLRLRVENNNKYSTRPNRWATMDISNLVFFSNFEFFMGEHFSTQFILRYLVKVECPTRALKTWKLEPELEISSSSQV